MNLQPQTLETLDTTTAPGPGKGRWLASLQEAMRTRRANRSTLSREIAAYPATRSASTAVLPADRRRTALSPADASRTRPTTAGATRLVGSSGRPVQRRTRLRSAVSE